jgi:predicted RNA-binding protein with RPS1 domain
MLVARACGIAASLSRSHRVPQKRKFFPRKGSLAIVALLAVVCQFLHRPAAFLGASRQQPKALRPLVGHLPGSSERRLHTQLAAARRRGGARTAVNYEVGEKVKAQFPEDGRWYPGRITSRNNDNTWTVKWDDPDGGPETNDLRRNAINKINFFRDYKVGDDCRAKDEWNNWYPGTVAELLKEDKFRVRWDDPDGGPETIDVHFENLQRHIVKRNWQTGVSVFAKYPTDSKMYEGTVVGRNDDGTFQVKWDDPDRGPEVSDVCAKDMQALPIPFSHLQVGEKYRGIVKEVRDGLGAFVDIGADGLGLLHMTRMTNEYVEDPRAFVDEEQDIDVWIHSKKYDGTNRFALTTLEHNIPTEQTVRRVAFNLGSGQKEGHTTDYSAFKKVDSSTWLEGTVARVTNFGAYITVKDLSSEAMAEGLVHMMQVSNTPVNNVAAFLKVDQKVKVRVLAVDVDAARMSLTMREPGGWQDDDDDDDDDAEY